MKVTFVGTGTMGSITRANQSLLIDNVLFDIGSGIVKKLESLKIYTKFIDYIVISHIHADHFFDIANFLIGRNIRGENSKRLTIIGGAGIRKNIVDLMNFSFGDGILGKYNDIESIYNVDIVELKNGDEYKNDEFCLRAFDLEHDGCKPILGFVFEKNGKKFGYVTDTVFCDNVERIVMEADYLFLDGIVCLYYMILVSFCQSSLPHFYKK